MLVHPQRWRHSEEQRLERDEVSILPAASEGERQKRDLFEYRDKEDCRQPVVGELPAPAVALLACEQQNHRDRAEVPQHIPRPVLDVLISHAHQHRQRNMHCDVDAIGKVHPHYASAITSISTSTSLGSRATSTVDLAGGACVK